MFEFLTKYHLGDQVKEESCMCIRERGEVRKGFWLEQLNIQLGRPRQKWQNNTTIDLRVTV
jgi:hypothetical protein